jgi:hypothetical protein
MDAQKLILDFMDDSKLDGVEFDKSWKHLKQVIDKIKVMCDNNDDGSLTDLWNEACDFDVLTIFCDIDTAFSVVVEFITLYNAYQNELKEERIEEEEIEIVTCMQKEIITFIHKKLSEKIGDTKLRLKVLEELSYDICFLEY